MPLLDSLRIAPEIDDESDEELAQDPAPTEKPPRPARKGRTARRPATRQTGSKPTTAKLAKQVAEDLASLIEGGAAVWSLSDQCCAPVLEQQARPIADAFTAILSRNPRLLEKFANADMAVYTLQSAALFRALAPVGKAVYANHVGKPKTGENHDHNIDLGQYPAYRPNLNI